MLYFLIFIIALPILAFVIHKVTFRNGRGDNSSDEFPDIDLDDFD